jgi:hypothetical protein
VHKRSDDCDHIQAGSVEECGSTISQVGKSAIWHRMFPLQDSLEHIAGLPYSVRNYVSRGGWYMDFIWKPV